jgi:hypothetical protein
VRQVRAHRAHPPVDGVHRFEPDPVRASAVAVGARDQLVAKAAGGGQ